MKALRKGFLKGCPNINKELVAKYLSPSPATAKGHMKCPKKGISSINLQPKRARRDDNMALPSTAAPLPPGAQLDPAVYPLGNNTQPYPGPAYNPTNGPNVIVDDKLIANMFCFGAFADKVNGVVYNNLAGNFPFMLLDGSVCFFVMYHYETNAILATLIANLDNKSIFKAYKAHFEMLEAKGYKPRVNVMDNQATKYIEQFLTKKECKLQLVEPHNHRVNAAKRVI